ncbi:MAG: acetyl/propionyl/methylcrotonyl-CoA carboxylase subunit alpha [Betaproteobacteria bacterium]|nr:acetyl/propionyl/methylcrotonyl-CoA carboxylase subunit alpha [Betaproteobacteria bacterium]
MFRKLLIANRGEIACRVIRTARRMGIATVAVYSDADLDAPHARLADEAHHIGPSVARESYLNIERIVAAARAAGADAIHPGYGFLAENEDFARACAGAGIVFVGPTPEAIRAMGDKSAAKTLMQQVGVPLVPGYHGENQDAGLLAAEAARIGYPVLIKASAGGGGKGMRIVGKAEEFAAALASCRREAASAFGDDRVLIERYLDRPRHIEVQVFGDTQGNVISLFERDCSVQRRHQKVLEEAPAPGMTEARRREMGDAAVSAARAIHYTGAGTVEFIAESETDRTGALSGRFYFMEMNTRLQVEHPVTEMITGLDLVEWQLRIAAGEPLPLGSKQLAIRGHALEVRVYAEDPERDFLPSTGRVLHLSFPLGKEAVRVDSGIAEGGEVTPHYDPMLAKLITWGENRDAALDLMAKSLAATRIAGVTTNVAFLGRAVASHAFRAAELDTGLIERNRAELFPAPVAAPDEVLAAAVLAELLAEQDAAQARARASGDPYSPWHTSDGWRLNEDSQHTWVFDEGGRAHALTVHFRGDGWLLRTAHGERSLDGERISAWELRVLLDGHAFNVHVAREDRNLGIFHAGALWRLVRHDDVHEVESDAHAGSLAAPMPGKVVAVLVEPGARVEKGAPLVILEAMKMEHTIVAPSAGTVKEVCFTSGEQVSEGVDLIVFDAA